jgi:hypothetical protein
MGIGYGLTELVILILLVYREYVVFFFLNDPIGLFGVIPTWVNILFHWGRGLTRYPTSPFKF